MSGSRSARFRSSTRRVVVSLSRWALGIAIALAPCPARADDTIRTPGDHPKYPIELEPHVALGWGNEFGSNGVGIGGRFSVPVVQNGFVKSINNSVAISFGLDWVHYSGCFEHEAAPCGANYINLPVVMQWNFFVGREWSVFGEPGLSLRFASYDACGGDKCGKPRGSGFDPLVLFLGGRWHFSEHTALTMRVGFPTFSVGVSFM